MFEKTEMKIERWLSGVKPPEDPSRIGINHQVEVLRAWDEQEAQERRAGKR